jgi:predicted transcriptional regulator
MFVCEQCGAQTPEEDAHRHLGRLLCDDCCMEALSPAKSCDPWATYTASRLPEQQLNPRQERIMELLRGRGQATAGELGRAAGLDQAALERELAALRHMELLRAAPDGAGGKVFKPF